MEPTRDAKSGDMFTLQPTEDLFDRMTAEYDAWFDSPEGRGVFASEVRCISPLLVDRPRPWLDVGVGPGRFAQALGADVGIDPAGGAVRVAATRGVSVVQGRGEALPFPESQFEVVLVVVTLCFAPSPLALLRECSRVLTSKGRIILGLVLADCPWGRFYQDLAKAGHRFYSRARFYSMQDVRQLASGSGLAVSGGYSTLFQPPGTGPVDVEEPVEGISREAGFVAICLTKGE